MAYCRNCGNALYDGDLFCPHCGMKVEARVAPPQQQPQMAPPPQQPQMAPPPQQPQMAPPPQQPQMAPSPYAQQMPVGDVRASNTGGEITVGRWQPQPSPNAQQGRGSASSARVKQIIGRVLFGASSILFGFGGYSLYNVFTNKSNDTATVQTTTADSTATTATVAPTQDTTKPVEQPTQPAQPVDEPSVNEGNTSVSTYGDPDEFVDGNSSQNAQRRSAEEIINSFGPNTDDEAIARVNEMRTLGQISREEADDCIRYIRSRGSIGQ